MLPEAEPSEDGSEPQCFVSETRNNTPVQGGPGDLDLERLESDPLSLLDTSSRNVDTSSRNVDTSGRNVDVESR